MKATPEGLPDKLYRRKAWGEWHCFQKLAQVRGYVSPRIPVAESFA
jgi:hypothetical protein